MGSSCRRVRHRKHATLAGSCTGRSARKCRETPDVVGSPVTPRAPHRGRVASVGEGGPACGWAPGGHCRRWRYQAGWERFADTPSFPGRASCRLVPPQGTVTCCPVPPGRLAVELQDSALCIFVAGTQPHSLHGQVVQMTLVSPSSWLCPHPGYRRPPLT